MTSFTERSLGYLFGLLGGALLAVGGIVSFLFGAVDLAFGHAGAALGAGAEGLVLLVVGGLALFFAYLARGAWRDRPLVSGVLLVVVAAMGWGVLALGGNLLALFGAIFVFLAGVLYLLVPLSAEIKAAASA